MKLIELTQGQATKVSDEWYEYLNQWKWQAQWNEDTKSFYAVRKEYNGKIREKISMSRVVVNTPKGMIADHINHDTLDNTVENLRNVTHSQNMMNKKFHSNNVLGIKNIRRKDCGFEVRIKKDQKTVLDKWFSNLEDAIRARDEAVKVYHGEFSYLSK